MSNATLSDPAAVQARLETIEEDLAVVQNDLEAAALEWFKARRDREKLHAERFVGTEGTVGERNAEADKAVAELLVETADGDHLYVWEAEGRYEGLKAKARVLDTRAAIGMAILKSQGRFSQ